MYKMNKTIITSALPYVNNVPHLGNIIGCVLSADVYSRFRKMKDGDENILFVCGTDEYGTTTEVKAKQENITCQELCDKYNRLHKQIYDWFNIDFDVFGRTTTDTHTELAQSIVTELDKNDYLEEKIIKQHYCNTCKSFLADRFLIGYCYNETCKELNVKTKGDQCDTCGEIIDTIKLISPKCSICNNEPEIKESEHLFIKLDMLEDKLNKYVDSVTLSNNAYGTSKAILKKGLHSRCITRDLKWGTKIPKTSERLKKYSDKVLYVWFDAPIGYLSIIKHGVKDYNKWLNPKVKWVEFMAKDNIQFHTILFPGILFGCDTKYPQMTELNATEYLTFQNEKFSKSQNKGVFGDDVQNISKKLDMHEDYWRYYLLKIRPEDRDTSFSWEDFVSSINADLNNNFGNFTNRGIVMCKKYFKGSITFDIENNKESSFVKDIIDTYVNSMNNIKIRDSIKIVLRLSAYGNKYIQDNKPWECKHDIEKQKEIISYSMYIIYVTSVLLLPFIPKTCYNIIKYITNDTFNILKDTKYSFTCNKEKYNIPFKQLDLTDVISAYENL